MVRVLGRIACRIACAAAVFAVASATAQAAPISMSVRTVSGAYYGGTFEGTLNPDGITYSAAGSGGNVTFGVDWSVAYEEDPFYLANFTIVNTSTSTQQFVLSVSLPVSPQIPGSSVMGGYFGQVTYTDTSLNSTVQINTVGSTPFFVPSIDGVDVQNLGIFTATAGGGPGVSGTVSQLAFGTPIPSAPGPAVLTNIGGVVTFELTPGDRAVFPIYFEVQPVPEPMAALLVGLGIAGLAVIRQRRSN